MYFEPYTEKELTGPTYIEGEATGVMEKVTLELSKKSNKPMLRILNKIWDKEENELQIIDFIPLELRWKISNVMKACGHIEKLKEGFHSEELPPLLSQNAFNCIIKYEPSKDDPETKYMQIKRYLEPFIPQIIKENNNPNKDISFDDDLPFS